MRDDGPNERALVVVAFVLGVTATVCALAAVALVLASGADHSRLEALSTGVVSLFFVAAGLAAWLTLPSSRVGPLLTAAGFAWIAGGLDESSVPLVYAVGEMLRPLFIPLAAHALLGFPAGRLRRLPDRAAALLLYVAVLVLGPARFLVSPEPNDDCGDCARNPLAVIDDHALLELLSGVQQVAVAAGVAGVALILARRWLLASPAGAHEVVPALVAAACAMVYLLALGAEQLIDPSDGAEDVLALIQILAASAVPVLLLVGIRRTPADPALPKR